MCVCFMWSKGGCWMLHERKKKEQSVLRKPTSSRQPFRRSSFVISLAVNNRFSFENKVRFENFEKKTAIVALLFLSKKFFGIVLYIIIEAFFYREVN